MPNAEKNDKAASHGRALCVEQTVSTRASLKYRGRMHSHTHLDGASVHTLPRLVKP
jgi:hypothetical protein